MSLGLEDLLNKGKRAFVGGLVALSFLSFSSCKDNPSGAQSERDFDNPPIEENSPPVISSNPPTIVDELKHYTYRIQATDPDGDDLSYKLVEAPNWLEIDGKTIFGRAPEVPKDSDYDVTLEVSDGKDNAEQKYLITVNNLYNVQVLSAGEISQSTISEDDITFSEPKEFSEGDILVSGITDKTPYGILREVKEVSSDKRFVQTGPAVLQQALRQGTFTFDQKISPKRAKLSRDAPKGVHESFNSGFDFSYDLDNVVLYDPYGDGSNTVILDGHLSFNLNPDFNVDFDDPYISFEISFNQESDINVISNVNGYGNSFYETFPLTNLPPISFLVGTIPVVITPSIEMNVGMTPENLALLDVQVSNNLDISPGLFYENRSWRGAENMVNYEFDSSIEKMDSQKGLGIEAYVGPLLRLSLYDYGSISPSVIAGINGSLKFEAQSNQDWKLMGGLNAFLRLDPGRILRGSISPYEKEIISLEEILAEGTPEDDGDEMEGKILFVRRSENSQADIYKMNPDGTGLTNLTNTNSLWETHPSCSPDGSKIAYDSKVPFSGDIEKIYVMDFDGSNKISLKEGVDPVFSPDGSKIAYGSASLGHTLYLMDVDGSNSQTVTSGGRDHNHWDLSWLSGQKILFSSNRDADNKREIYSIMPDGTDIKRLTYSDSYDRHPAWSPDGSKIAFSSDRSGVSEIYVMKSDGSNLKNISNSPNSHERQPFWSPDGSKIVYASYPEGSDYEQTDIYIMGYPSGSNKRKITNTSTNQGRPIWCRE